MLVSAWRMPAKRVPEGAMIPLSVLWHLSRKTSFVIVALFQTRFVPDRSIM
jgi:hypothetical protein